MAKKRTNIRAMIARAPPMDPTTIPAIVPELMPELLVDLDDVPVLDAVAVGCGASRVTVLTVPPALVSVDTVWPVVVVAADVVEDDCVEDV